MRSDRHPRHEGGRGRDYEPRGRGGRGSARGGRGGPGDRQNRGYPKYVKPFLRDFLSKDTH